MQLRPFRPFSLACASILTQMASPVVAQPEATLPFDILGVGVIEHVEHGMGVELRVAPRADLQIPKPTGGWGSQVTRFCDDLAAEAIPFLVTIERLPRPDFIAIRIVPGRLDYDRYKFHTFAVNGIQCGGAL